MILINEPQKWNSAFSKDGIKFIFDHQEKTIDHVNNVSGHVQFNMVSTFTYTPDAGDKIFVAGTPGGIYDGFHTVISAMGFNIDVETTYTSTSLGGTAKYIRIPEIKLYSGFAPGEIYDEIKPLSLVATFTPENNVDNQVSFYVHGYLQSLFNNISAPLDIGVATTSMDLFDKFRLYYDGEYHDPYFVLYSTLNHTVLNEQYVNNGNWLTSNDYPPIVFDCGKTILTMIVHDEPTYYVYTDGSPTCDFGNPGDDFAAGDDFVEC